MILNTAKPPTRAELEAWVKELSQVLCSPVVLATFLQGSEESTCLASGTEGKSESSELLAVAAYDTLTNASN